MKILVDANLLIYLNVGSKPVELYEFWRSLVKSHELYTDIIVIDETLYISKKKYGISYADTIEFLEKTVLPFVDIIPIGIPEYVVSKKFMLKYSLPPSDAIHAAVIELHGLQAIASEDKHFEKTEFTRLWPSTNH